MLELSLVCAERDKERPNAKWTKRSGTFRARPYLANPETCKHKRLQDFSIPKKQQEIKDFVNVFMEEARLHPKQAAKLGNVSYIVLALYSLRIQE